MTFRIDARNFYARQTNQRSGSALTVYTRPTRLSRIALEAAVLIGVVVFILTIIGKAMAQ